MHCTENIVSARLHTHPTSAERVGQGEVGGHMAAARLGYKRAMVGTGWGNSHPWLHEHA